MAKNEEIAKILFELAEMYEMQNIPFKPRVFERASESVASLEDDVADLYKEGGLKALEGIPSVGRGIAERIEEYLKTGEMKEYNQIKKKFPVDIAELSSIDGVGPKLINLLYTKLKIRTVADLEKAAKGGKLRSLPRMGAKLEAKILKGIEFKREGGGRFALGEALPMSRAIKDRLLKITDAEEVEVAGSVRRMQETIGDLDFLVVSGNPKKISDYFVKMPEVAHIYARGETKVNVRLKSGIDADLRIVPKKSFGAALQYFTGNKDHNVEVRKIAIKKGYKLNEYGLFRGKKNIAAESEEEIYKKLGMSLPPPEMRLNLGEIEAALRQAQGKPGGLPNSIGYDDLRGDLQTQTSWTDGKNSIEEMAREAEKIGHEYIAITDHTRSLAMTGGSDEKKLARQAKEIDRVNEKFSARGGSASGGKNIKILKGAEVNIMKDGSLDIDDEALAKLDVVGAAVHSLFNLTKKEQTERIIRAMENPNVDILFHPTGRVINRRKPYDVDMEKIIKAAKRTGTILEIDGHPWRLDLKDEHIRMAREAGVKMVIDTDAHSTSELHYLEYGIAQARRAWCTKKDIINTLPLKEFLGMLK
ncbi:DNA polymerase III [Candidatus Giovannonibacteria bacterium RIFCSPLOWO2_01_FULL_46_13]|uniref:DNA polymerase beta n=1 Tax=Candidatus Giovannonibacteria bacterium RIFCSPLOWO2_01_FULL_46_13 TaxID=1798352 RepID=A0A1F5X3V9_9BACT|nr:MAG: DNA polymerase III [Candidatus Giovannonibacteria bacterium RIFCSPLOWO2_01_FULL_46_13]